MHMLRLKTMPPKRTRPTLETAPALPSTLTPSPATNPNKKLKSTAVLPLTNHAENQSRSPKKTRGGARLEGPKLPPIIADPLLKHSNGVATVGKKLTAQKRQRKRVANGGQGGRKELFAEEDTIALRMPDPPCPPPPASTLSTASSMAVIVTSQPSTALINPKPSIPHSSQLRGNHREGFDPAHSLLSDENSLFFKSQVAPLPLRKTTTRTSRQSKVSALPTQKDHPVLENPALKDDPSTAKSLLSSKSPLDPNAAPLAITTNRVANAATITTAATAERGREGDRVVEPDVFTDGFSSGVPSRRGRGGRKAADLRNSTLLPPPVFALPKIIAHSNAFPKETVNEGDVPSKGVEPPHGQAKATRGGKASTRLTAKLPEVVANDIAIPEIATRGRGRGRGKGRGRGRGTRTGTGTVSIRGGRGTGRGGKKPTDARDEPTVEDVPISDDVPIAVSVPTAISPQKESTYTGPVTQLGLKLLQDHVLEKLCERGEKQLVGFKEEYRHTYHLLKQTVVSGEGNSMLLIGPRGVGKSMLVETAISSLQSDYKGQFLVVRLSGFLQTDDKIAIREIWRQLGVEMDLEEGQPKMSNFADTLASILALLSHPDELGSGTTDAEQTGENTGSKTSLSVIFVLEEFDLFVTHPRQTLLYNLFDIAQARKAPIAVLGLTSRVDVVEGLEKRVKSRFSHRSVHLRLAATLEQFWGIVRSGLEVHLKGEIQGVGEKEKGYWRRWNEMLEILFEESKGFRKLLHRTFALSKDATEFWASYCLYPVSHLVSLDSPYLTDRMFVWGTAIAVDALSYPLTGPDSRLHILPALTELELSLLIAAARLDIVSDTESCNFNMAYEEYKSLASKVRVQNSIGSTVAGGGVPGGGQGGKLWSREVAMAAWEGLGRWEVIVPAGTNAAGGGGVATECRMWRVDVGLAEIGRCAGAQGGPLGGVLGKWCREI